MPKSKLGTCLQRQLLHKKVAVGSSRSQRGEEKRFPLSFLFLSQCTSLFKPFFSLVLLLRWVCCCWLCPGLVGDAACSRVLQDATAGEQQQQRPHPQTAWGQGTAPKIQGSLTGCVSASPESSRHWGTHEKKRLGCVQPGLGDFLFLEVVHGTGWPWI